MTPATQTEALDLLVLSDPGTGLLAKGPRPSGFPANVTIVANRQDALAVLRKQGRHTSARRPALVLLELDGQGEQGWTLLREIKMDPQTRRIPIIVLGTPDSIERARAYDLHANCYLPRPEDKERFALLLDQIEDFWLAKVRLPTG